MGKYIIYHVNGASFVPYHQVKILDKELQELKMANKNLQSMLDMVLKAKGGKGVSEDSERGNSD
jgi:hypothetical protein